MFIDDQLILMTVLLSAHSASSSIMGRLKLCPYEALKAWAAKAVEHFGSVAAWTPAIFAEAGTLIGKCFYQCA